ncbi:hypothetical protein [Neokomagataea anthophila]|uniref:Uncharacterized protein n=1 Tax=Neokomagataea anthophila TaxID=2826925 RepID=A0ABS5E766_9PROT|nr:hypothetical protein [Neokomagataea anthophila]MBR0559734.1 hypothetical protein [Neokomagataea anthophila]
MNNKRRKRTKQQIKAIRAKELASRPRPETFEEFMAKEISDPVERDKMIARCKADPLFVFARAKEAGRLNRF